MTEKTIEPYYMRQAKDLTTMLFDKRFLNDALSKDSIDWLQEYLGLVLEQTATGAAKAATLTAKFRDQALVSE